VLQKVGMKAAANTCGALLLRVTQCAFGCWELPLAGFMADDF
jgi:hypothetical protein